MTMGPLQDTPPQSILHAAAGMSYLNMQGGPGRGRIYKSLEGQNGYSAGCKQPFHSRVWNGIYVWE